MLGNEGSRSIYGLMAMTEAVPGCVHTIAVLQNELVFSEKGDQYITRCLHEIG